ASIITRYRVGSLKSSPSCTAIARNGKSSFQGFAEPAIDCTLIDCRTYLPLSTFANVTPSELFASLAGCDNCVALPGACRYLPVQRSVSGSANPANPAVPGRRRCRPRRTPGD